MRATALPFLIGLIALAGCPGDEPVNAPTVWLAPDGSEIKVKLSELEPDPW